MPLSPIPIIVGTTIATVAVVVGTGYVFKKLVYDPHISHHIEAFIASHQALSSRPHEPIPVSTEPLSSTASTTAYQDHHTSLRRRSGHGAPPEGDHHYSNEFELEERTSRPLEEYGGASAYELEESRISLSGQGDAARDPELDIALDLGSASRGRSTPVSLIDFNECRPDSPQDAEVREVIFKLAPTPLRSGSSTPALGHHDQTQPNLDPFSDDSAINRLSSLPPLRDEDQTPTGPQYENGEDNTLRPHPPSTTFSFLSLSQQSSPEQLHPQLGSIAELISRERGGTGTPTLPDDGDYDDIISLPETSTTSFEDAESYTPISRALSPAVPGSLPSGSPASPPIRLSHESDRVNSQPTAMTGTAVFGRVEELGMSYVPLVLPVRGPLSVISMSGSESGEYEADGEVGGEWDILSDRGQ